MVGIGGGWGEGSRFKAMRTGDDALCFVTERESHAEGQALLGAPTAAAAMRRSTVVPTLSLASVSQKCRFHNRDRRVTFPCVPAVPRAELGGIPRVLPGRFFGRWPFWSRSFPSQ